MYLSRLGVIDAERLIRPMTICMIGKFVVQTYNVVHQRKAEFLNILSFTLASQEFFPGLQQVFQTNNIFETMIKIYPSTPPTRHLCPSSKSLLWFTRFGMNICLNSQKTTVIH